MKNRPRLDMAQGTLLVTGVSPRPDAEGQQYVTIAGVKGPTVDELIVVHQRLVVDVHLWPSMGQLIPVVYSAKNPTTGISAQPGQAHVPGVVEILFPAIARFPTVRRSLWQFGTGTAVGLAGRARS